MTDYYALLGVDAEATDAEIKAAYRSLARRLHPDANPGDPESEARFKEISVAYETLRDPERRRRYDMFGPEGARAGGGGPGADFGGIHDIFEAFFGGDGLGRRGGGGPQRGADAEVAIQLDLADVVPGVTRILDLELPVACARCDATGCAPGTHPERCATCGGSGQVREVRRSVLGQVMTAAVCRACRGEGVQVPSPCEECGGEGRRVQARTIEVDVPAGIADGQRLRLAGRGPAARRGGPPGDLYVSLRVREHPELRREGNDLVRTLRVAMTQAALGARLEIDTLDGPVEAEVAPGTQPGAVMRIAGHGLPDLRSGRRGDLRIEVEVEVPTRLSAEEAEALARFAELRGDDVAPRGNGLLSRLRSAFQE